LGRILLAVVCSAALAAVAVWLWVWAVVPQPGHVSMIIPPWWALPGYALLREAPSKVGGVLLAVTAAFGLFLVPWILLGDVKSRVCRPAAILALALFLGSIVVLGISGCHEPDDPVLAAGVGPLVLGDNLNTQLWLSRAMTLYFFAYVVVIAPALGWRRRADISATFG
jgi:quinol-cytochrome oxidoreductase complex cytochrome b subunit